jgi:AraC-like DNA-binding protein
VRNPIASDSEGTSGVYALLRRQGVWSVLVGHETCKQARSQLLWHTHGWQARYIVRGEQRIRTETRWHCAQAGEVLVTRWAEPHGTEGQPDKQHECYMVKFHAVFPRARFLGLPPEYAGRLRHAMDMLPHVFTGSWKLRSLFRETLASGLAERPGSMDDFRSFTLLLALLIEIVRCGKSQSHSRANKAWRQRIDAFLESNLGRLTGVAEMAEHMGLAPGAFGARFRRVMGTGAGNYLLRMKMKQAERLLRETDQPVVNIAARLGFGSPQHFSNAFHRWAGLSPGRWRGGLADARQGAPRRPIARKRQSENRN